MKYSNNISSNVTGFSERHGNDLFDLYEVYKMSAYTLGAFIILSNFIVVISSGLILRNGLQPKSTYLLLGNVSLADTVTGIAFILGASTRNVANTDMLCYFQLGMVVCPAIVSIYSVGCIAVDRYIYILHGLYYQRWCNTNRVRMVIFTMWIIGIILGFMPITGWVTTEHDHAPCVYFTVFPAPLILFNTFISIFPIILVAILYTIILIKALKNITTLKAAEQPVNLNLESEDTPKLRIHRNNNKKTDLVIIKGPINNTGNLKRSASFDTKLSSKSEDSIKTISTGDLTIDSTEKSFKFFNKENQNCNNLNKSEFSIYSIASTCSENKSSWNNIAYKPKSNSDTRTDKSKESSKCRAITIVLLTTSSFIATWVPFFVVIILYVLCNDKVSNPECHKLRHLLVGPTAILAFINCILNPFIYAWWHKGFKMSLKACYKRCIHSYLCSNPNPTNIEIKINAI